MINGGLPVRGGCVVRFCPDCQNAGMSVQEQLSAPAVKSKIRPILWQAFMPESRKFPGYFRCQTDLPAPSLYALEKHRNSRQ